MNKQSGFTLIELIMVIVILGILAATAIPRFVDLSDAAETAALQGVLGSVQAALAINYAASVTPGSGETLVTTCDGVEGLLQGGSLPADYSIDDGATLDCELEGPGGTVEFSLLN